MGLAKHKLACDRRGEGRDSREGDSVNSELSSGNDVELSAASRVADGAAALVDLPRDNWEHEEENEEEKEEEGRFRETATASQVREFIVEMAGREVDANIDQGAAGGAAGPTVAINPQPARRARRTEEVFTVEYLIDLVVQFQTGLYKTHYSWREPMRDICVKCWDLATAEDEQIAAVNFAGFLILPGLISAMRGVKRGQSVVEFLVQTAGRRQPGRVIVEKARILLEEREPRTEAREFRPPTLASLAKQVDKCIDEDRFSAAAGVVERMHAISTGVEIQPPRNLAEFRAKVGALHPQADVMDELPDAADDPEARFSCAGGNSAESVAQIRQKGGPRANGVGKYHDHIDDDDIHRCQWACEAFGGE